MPRSSLSHSSPATGRRSADGQRRLASLTVDRLEDLAPALAAVDDGPWVLGLVFAHTRQALAAAGAATGDRFDGIRLAGCTSAGIVDRHGRVGAAAQITLFGGDGFACEISIGRPGDGSRDAGIAAAGALSQLGHRRASAVLILLADGLVGDTNDIVRGAYEVVGATVPIVGGCAGDDLAMTATHQLIDGRVVTESVIGIALASSGSVGLGVHHGWSPSGHPMTVTSSSGTSVLTLDDRPALDVYLEAIGHVGEPLTAAGLATLCQTSPLGLSSRSGYHVRFIRGGDPVRRSIEFLVAIPEGETVTVMGGDTSSVLGAAGEAAARAVAEAGAGGHPVLGVVAFDCVACRGVIGDDLVAEEIGRLTASLPPEATVSGLYTYGEIARRGGALGFHNQTMVVLALA
ncbi:MAG: FIST signal transduction protein [Acidimicrobiales bacterium]